MVIDTVDITLRRTGEQATLVCQGRPMGVAVKITHEQLDHLIAEFTHFSAQWRATTTPNPYVVLGVTRDASAEEIQHAYRTRAKQDHPDTSAGTTAAMQALNEAYAVLGDPQQRQTYDRTL